MRDCMNLQHRLNSPLWNNPYVILTHHFIFCCAYEDDGLCEIYQDYSI